MILTRFINSRTFTTARRFSTLLRTARSTPNVGNQLQAVAGRRFMSAGTPDISMTEGLIWIFIGGVPISLFGMYITKTLRDAIEATEAGELMPGTGPQRTLTNDQWLALKEQAKKMLDEEDDDSEVAAAGVELDVEDAKEEEFVVLEDSVPSPDPEPVESSKDRIIFIDPPTKE